MTDRWQHLPPRARAMRIRFADAERERKDREARLRRWEAELMMDELRWDSIVRAGADMAVFNANRVAREAGMR